MRKYTIPQNMTAEYLISTGSIQRLGDHLGSTSITTDSNGALISEIRYKPWGEVRYTWTAPLSTTPAYKLVNYTFTGQYSYMDDPSTAGVTEGFGLMFYNARWYDPVSGRFAQADTIIPGGAQGWDRYAYVNNAPTRFTDPSGHRCVPEDECDTPQGDFSRGPISNTPLLLTLSNEGLEFIKLQEGFQPIPYNDGLPLGHPLYFDRTGRGLGNCTVGYGHLIHTGPCDGRSDEESFIGVSVPDALKHLEKDIKSAEAVIKEHITAPLTQSQYDALVSLFLNWGYHPEYPDKINLINDGKYEEAGIHFLKRVF